MQVCLLMGTWGRHDCLPSTLQGVRGAVARRGAPIGCALLRNLPADNAISHQGMAASFP
jgi:hypothetical protein